MAIGWTVQDSGVEDEGERYAGYSRSREGGSPAGDYASAVVQDPVGACLALVPEREGAAS